jgi:hypothetical protein
VIVTDADYDNIFNGRSPPNPEKLRDVIAAIAFQGPKLIAVDIDTSDQQFQHFGSQFKGPGGKLIPVIWEREVVSSGENEGLEFEPLDVIGWAEPQTEQVLRDTRLAR